MVELSRGNVEIDLRQWAVRMRALLMCDLHRQQAGVLVLLGLFGPRPRVQTREPAQDAEQNATRALQDVGSWEEERQQLQTEVLHRAV